MKVKTLISSISKIPNTASHWLMAVTLATQEIEIRKIGLKGIPGM
jgi:hypothetical protein